MIKRQHRLYSNLNKHSRHADDEKYLQDLRHKLANPTTGQKLYWKVVNRLLNKCQAAKIPPLLFKNNLIVNCKDKAIAFNKYFTSLSVHHW